MRRLRALRCLLVSLLTAVLVTGCAAITPRNALPETAAQGQPNEFRHIRYWGDEGASDVTISAASPQVESEVLRGRNDATRRLNLLAISGGAEDGAFGAGLLAGWGDAGNRPPFDLVTGVSSGALIAPFVFLGRQRDVQLKEIFTKYSTKDIVDFDTPSLLQGSAILDNDPLSHLIERYVDREFMREIAVERSRGRVLLIGTTNLDAQRPVLWDMGLIAARDNLEALNLFRKVLLASATLPGVFAPVRIKVRVGGEVYDELHVDGGVTRQVFMAPSILHLASGNRTIANGARLFVIRNGRIDPQWKSTNANMVSVTLRSLSTLIKNQGIGDLYRIYSVSKARGIEFNLASIPPDFNVPMDELFDRKYMSALFERGYEMGSHGYPWIKSLPGLQAADQQPHSKL
ncbi:patatin-like phospholipase family protein [Bradyrhizobium sp.]|uniref:patatin-like phospholipase family protein n=1 Tax=Bradyrhizobium sp. TaxID=376 RepID=UPI001ECC84E8|nr:patatin-like phospholipase family protein [Bradyrhizobium sp.]MBV8922038.1 patatin-like phospholipase family protein [Bradyrhizobium sp.]MBV9985766.1 patatin-like phospholipase family protein [Bradyrhizobium sp.]